jgi:hypothetical protein
MSKRDESSDNLFAKESFGGRGGGCGSKSAGGALFAAGGALALGGDLKTVGISAGIGGLGSWASCKGYM